jgi:hypothetical protein
LIKRGRYFKGSTNRTAGASVLKPEIAKKEYASVQEFMDEIKAQFGDRWEEVLWLAILEDDGKTVVRGDFHA